jgi:predicted peptidase
VLSYLRRLEASSILAATILVGTLGVSATAASESASGATSPGVSPSASSPSQAPDAIPAASGLVARPIGSVDGAPLGYVEYLPPGYGDGEPRPLLVYAHSAGGPGDGTAGALGLVATEPVPLEIQSGTWPADRPFVVLAPQFSEALVEDGCGYADDLAAFLEFAMDHYTIDAQQVYLTGISCGAIGIWDYLGAHGDEIVAASVPIAGHAEWALEEFGCDTLATSPVWAFHGDSDEIVPTVHIRGPMELIRACTGADSVEMELTVYPDADHDAWSRTYDGSAGHDIYAWLLEHQLD